MRYEVIPWATRFVISFATSFVYISRSLKTWTSS